jgi:hypothetical protein
MRCNVDASPTVWNLADFGYSIGENSPTPRTTASPTLLKPLPALLDAKLFLLIPEDSPHSLCLNPLAGYPFG